MKDSPVGNVCTRHAQLAQCLLETHISAEIAKRLRQSLPIGRRSL
jgi:hypothetical protein